jgi:hypothetical protein
MIFTGTELTVKRNFYTQTGALGFVLDCLVDNTTGAYHFGISGNQGVFDFTLQSGKMFCGSDFIHSYVSDEEFALSVQFSSGAVNVIKDGTALVYGKPKATGSYDYFYFTRQNSTLGGSFDLEISGENVPETSISEYGYLSQTGQAAVTGYLFNNSEYPIRVFDSSIQASANYSFGKLAGEIAANSSGFFAFTGDFSTIDYSQPILTTLNTNYGDVSILFSIYDSATQNRFVYLTAPTTFAPSNDNVIQRETSWLNYSGGFVVENFSTSLTFRLQYSSGAQTFTGVWDMYTGNNASSLVSLTAQGFYSTGMISGAGTFAPNSGMVFQILYSGVSGNAAQLIISGGEVNNPISQILNFLATG